jgi:hypothetical protein
VCATHTHTHAIGWETHSSLALFVFKSHCGCLEAEKTDAGLRALAPAQGNWDTHVCKESICEV